jgi:hypothetical protein
MRSQEHLQEPLFTEARPPAAAPVRETRVASQRPAPVWLQRMSLVVLAVFCFYIGGLLAVLPWWTRYWAENGWMMGHPAVNVILQRGWVRGLISGIGLLDVWIGISEMIHYRDYRA